MLKMFSSCLMIFITGIGTKGHWCGICERGKWNISKTSLCREPEKYSTLVGIGFLQAGNTALFIKMKSFAFEMFYFDQTFTNCMTN